MAAGKYNFSIEQGSTFNLNLNYNDSTNTPVDLTGFNAMMQIRATPSAPTTIACIQGLTGSLSGSGINMANAVSGSIQIFIDAPTTSAMNFGSAYYDLILFTDPATGTPIVNRILQGQVQLNLDVTRGTCP